MTRKRHFFTRSAPIGVLLLALAEGLTLVGCSSDDAVAPDPNSISIALPDFDELVADALPPTYSGATAVKAFSSSMTPDTSLGRWTQGNGALLRKAFGDQQLMAIHRNVVRLRETVQWVNRVRRLGDSSFAGIPDDSDSLSGTMTVSRIQNTAIPDTCRAALGDVIAPLRYRVTVRFNEQIQTRLEAGVRQDDTCNILLAYGSSPTPDSLYPNALEYRLMYAYQDRVRDSLQLRAMHIWVANDGTGKTSMWTYEVAVRHQNQFFYRMTWCADDFNDSTGTGCFIGSGDCGNQFALRYCQMVPADREEPDPNDPLGHVYRVFGANYTDQGTSLSAGFNSATDPAKMFRYEHLPMALGAAPSTIESALNPWYGL